MTTAVTHPNILLVDDDSVLLKNLTDFFSKEGWQYDVVRDGPSALKAATKQEYDVVITDLVLPGLGGLELLQKLREHRPTQAIIVVSGTKRIQDATELLRMGGAVDFIEKPVNLELLGDAIERVTGKREAELRGTLYHHVQSEKTVIEYHTSQLAQTRPSCGMLHKLLASGKIDSITKYRLELAFQEAVANSLEHGNLGLLSAWREEIDSEGNDKFSRMKRERLADPHYGRRLVTITTEFRENQIMFVIEDQGDGFAFASTGSTPDQQGNAELRVHGRGVSIMMGVMDEVVYSNGGRKVTLIKQLQ